MGRNSPLLLIVQVFGFFLFSFLDFLHEAVSCVCSSWNCFLWNAPFLHAEGWSLLPRKRLPLPLCSRKALG